jgi:hypothetical protein
LRRGRLEPRSGHGESVAPEVLLAIAATLAIVVISPLATVLAAALSFLKRRYVVEFRVAVVVSVVLTAALARPAVVQWQAALAAVHDPRLTADPRDALAAAWRSIRAAWLLMIPAAPLCTIVIGQLRGYTVDDKVAAEEQRHSRAQKRRTAAAQRRAQKLTAQQEAEGPAISHAIDPEWILLGSHIDGERVDYLDRRRRVALGEGVLRQHVLVVGPSGSGKTETLFRLAYGAARAGYDVWYFDAKADPHARERFRSIMQMAGKASCLVFPNHGFNGFRGDGYAIFNRLIELVRYSAEGDGAYYRDVAKRLLLLACTAPKGPPRSSAELLKRLSDVELGRLDPTVLDELARREVAGVRLRYHAFFAALRGQLDGDVSFEDGSSGYVMLDGLSLKEEAGSLARFLIEDFTHYAKHRKHEHHRVLLILDEFSAIADSADVVNPVERLRSLNVGVVLAPQAEAGLSDDERDIARITENMETVFLHSVKRPESLAALAGTKRAVESSLQHEDGRPTGAGSGRSQHVWKVDPNDVRALQPGECFVIRKGRAARIQIARAPDGVGQRALPEPALSAWQPAAGSEMPKHLRLDS